MRLENNSELTAGVPVVSHGEVLRTLAEPKLVNGKVAAAGGFSKDNENLRKEAEDLRNKLNTAGVALKIRIKEDSNRVQVEVLDSECKKVLRKIPSDEILKLSSAIEKSLGVYMDKAL